MRANTKHHRLGMRGLVCTLAFLLAILPFQTAAYANDAGEDAGIDAAETLETVAQEDLPEVLGENLAAEENHPAEEAGELAQSALEESGEEAGGPEDREEEPEPEASAAAVPLSTMPVTSFAELQEAVAAAADGDVIEIANSFSVTSAIALNKSLTLRAAEGAAVKVQLNAAKGIRHFVITGGEVRLTTDGVTLYGSNRGGGIRSEADHLILDAVIQNCVASDIPYTNAGTCGGGVYVANSYRLTVVGGEIAKNNANNGGGIYGDYGSTITIAGGQISRNTAANEGGGVSGYRAVIAVEGGRIYQNTAMYGGGVFGGETSTVTVESGEITANSSNQGAGVHVNGRLDMTGGVISENQTGGSGGGIYGDIDAIITVIGGEVSENKAGTGGGLYGNRSIITVKGGRIAENNARANGGGIGINNYGAVIVSDGELSENMAANGGGIYSNASAGVTVTGGEIAKNTATDNGGGIYAPGSVTITGGKIIRNTSNIYGGGIYGNATNTTFSISGGEICNNVAVKDGGGIYIRSLERLEIRGNTVVSNNYCPTAYYLEDPDLIQLHAEKIDPTVSWTSGFQYIYNNLDVYNTTGATTPPTTPGPEPGVEHTITVTQVFADGSQADIVNAYTAQKGESFHTTFSIPSGYEAAFHSTGSGAAVDLSAGTIDIAEVAEDVQVTITYTPTGAAGDHTVSITIRYLDGALPDNTESFQVVNGASFRHTLDVLEGYEMVGYRQRTMPVVDWETNELFLDSVTQDWNFTFEFDKMMVVSITIKYADGALPDNTERYYVSYGASFHHKLSVLEGYEMIGYRQRTMPVVNWETNELFLDSVTEDWNFTFEFDRVFYTVTVTVRYDSGAIADQVTTYNVPYGDPFEAVFAVESGYTAYSMQADRDLYINIRSKTIGCDRVTSDLNGIVFCK